MEPASHKRKHSSRENKKKYCMQFVLKLANFPWQQKKKSTYRVVVVVVVVTTSLLSPGGAVKKKCHWAAWLQVVWEP